MGEPILSTVDGAVPGRAARRAGDPPAGRGGGRPGGHARRTAPSRPSSWPRWWPATASATWWATGCKLRVSRSGDGRSSCAWARSSRTAGEAVVTESEVPGIGSVVERLVRRRARRAGGQRRRERGVPRDRHRAPDRRGEALRPGQPACSRASISAGSVTRSSSLVGAGDLQHPGHAPSPADHGQPVSGSPRWRSSRRRMSRSPLESMKVTSRRSSTSSGGLGESLLEAALRARPTVDRSISPVNARVERPPAVEMSTSRRASSARGRFLHAPRE